VDILSKAAAKRMADEEAAWRAQQDLSDLRRAEAIKADKARLNAAQGIAKKEMAALEKIAKPSKSTPKKAPAAKRRK
jgi:hypothetical protein